METPLNAFASPPSFSLRAFLRRLAASGLGTVAWATLTLTLHAVSWAADAYLTLHHLRSAQWWRASATGCLLVFCLSIVALRKPSSSTAAWVSVLGLDEVYNRVKMEEDDALAGVLARMASVRFSLKYGEPIYDVILGTLPQLGLQLFLVASTNVCSLLQAASVVSSVLAFSAGLANLQVPRNKFYPVPIPLLAVWVALTTTALLSQPLLLPETGAALVCKVIGCFLYPYMFLEFIAKNFKEWKEISLHPKVGLSVLFTLTWSSCLWFCNFAAFVPEADYESFFLSLPRLLVIASPAGADLDVAFYACADLDADSGEFCLTSVAAPLFAVLFYSSVGVVGGFYVLKWVHGASLRRNPDLVEFKKKFVNVDDVITCVLVPGHLYKIR